MTTEHVLSVKLYAAIFGALIFLTLSTAGVAFIDLGGNLNTVVALVIAVGKALLVILYFMHARYSSRLTWVFAAAGFFWLMILIGGTIDDVLTRERISF
jgi:cytochrome c oxidase subunit IV